MVSFQVLKSALARAASAGVVAALLVACESPATAPRAEIPPEPARPTPNAPKPNTGERIVVRSDPGVAYHLIRMTADEGGLLTIVTRRDGPSGTSFSRRELDCIAAQFRYLGEGDLLEDAERDGPATKLAPLVDGSISDAIARHACAKAGLGPAAQG
jgi:hypothetical protein